MIELIKEWLPIIAASISILITIVSIIFSLSKCGKTKRATLLISIFEELPNFIIEAEGIYGKGLGKAKLSYVLNKIHFLCNDYCLDYNEELYTNYINKILDTPSCKKITEELNEK